MRSAAARLAQIETTGYYLCVTTEPKSPDWDALYEQAAAQSGYFTTQQAELAGYSTQLLFKHIRAGRVERARRGIYKLVHFPAGEHEDLVVAWLWSERVGVLSHDTALSLHDLSDVLPGCIHLTLPETSRRRRFRVPPGVELHFADVAPDERGWFGPVPVTAPRRTLVDCATNALSPEHLRKAAATALRRGLVERSGILKVAEALAPYGGLPA